MSQKIENTINYEDMEKKINKYLDSEQVYFI